MSCFIGCSVIVSFILCYTCLKYSRYIQLLSFSQQTNVLHSYNVYIFDDLMLDENLSSLDIRPSSSDPSDGNRRQIGV